MTDGLAGVEQRRQRLMFDGLVEDLREILHDTVPLVQIPGGAGEAPPRYEYRCQHGDGVIRNCTPQQAKQAQLMGRPVEQRTVTDWVRVPR